METELPVQLMGDCMDKIRRFQDDQAVHKQANVCLSVMVDLIKERNLGFSPTAYFGAIMSSLDSYRSTAASSASKKKAQTPQDETLPEALMLLLSTVFPSLPQAVVKSKAGDICELLESLMASLNENTSVMRHSLVCLQLTLEAQDQSQWTLPVWQRFFKSLLKSCLHSKPKVRRQAIASVTTILRSASPEGVTAAGEVLAAAAVKIIKQCSPKSTLHSLHALGLLAQALPVMGPQHQIAVTTAMFHLPTIGDNIVTLQTFMTLEHLLKDSTELQPAVLIHITEGLCAIPPADGSQTSVLHSQVLAASLTTLFAALPDAAVSRMGACVALLCECLAFPTPTSREAAATALKSIFSTIITPQMGANHITAASAPPAAAKASKKKSKGVSSLKEDGSDSSTPLTAVLASCEGLLQVRFKVGWSQVFQVLGALFKALGKASHPLLDEVLKVLDSFHPHCEPYHKSALDSAIGQAAIAMGLEPFFTLLPMQIEDEASLMQWDFEAKSRSWLLPLLREHLSHTDMAAWSNYFLPLASRLHARMKVAKESSPATAKKIEALVEQIFLLFPKFCEYPTNVGGPLRASGKILTKIISTEPSLRDPVCRGLAMLLRQAQAQCEVDVSHRELSIEDAQATVEAMRGVYKNFLPGLFNAFQELCLSRPGRNEGQPLLEAIAAFTSLAEPAYVNEMFKSVMHKLLSVTAQANDSSSHLAQGMLELALVLVPSLDRASVELLYKALKTQVSDADPLVQKKAYKLLRRLCDSHAWLLPAIAPDLNALLSESVLLVQPSARKTRLQALSTITTLLPVDQLALIPEILPEVIASLKEVNVKSKRCAFDCLVLMGKRLSEQGAMSHFLSLVLGGVAASTPHMKSAAVMALSRILYEFCSQVESAAVSELVEAVALLLRDKNREVCKAVLGFLKVAVYALEPAQLALHLPSLVEGLLVWTGDNRHHFKSKIRFLFEKLVKKLGYDAVMERVPEEHKKLLVHIKRMKERAKKVRDAHSKSFESLVDSEDEMSEEEEDEDKDKEDQSTSAKGRSANQKQAVALMQSRASAAQVSRPPKPQDGTWIKESASSQEVLDFLDPSAARHVTSVNPNKKRKRDDEVDDDDDVKVDAKTGKVVISFDSDDDQGSSEEEGEELAKELKGRRKMVVKKKMRTEREEEDEEWDMEDGEGGDKKKKDKKSFDKKSFDKKPFDKKQQFDKREEKGQGHKGGKAGAASGAGERKSLSLLASRRAEASRRKAEGHKVRFSGSEFKGKQGGDVSKEGKHLPFAYVQLNPKMLNKRKRLKAIKSLETVVQKAQTGALRGAKARKEQMKKKVAKKGWKKNVA